MADGQFFHHLLSYRVGGYAEPIHQDAFLTVPGFNGIHYRLVGRIAVAFKSIDFRDLKFGRTKREGSFGTGDLILLQVKVNRVTSLFEPIHGFGNGVVGEHTIIF